MIDFVKSTALDNLYVFISGIRVEDIQVPGMAVGNSFPLTARDLETVSNFLVSCQRLSPELTSDATPQFMADTGKFYIGHGTLSELLKAVADEWHREYWADPGANDSVIHAIVTEISAIVSVADSQRSSVDETGQIEQEQQPESQPAAAEDYALQILVDNHSFSQSIDNLRSVTAKTIKAVDTHNQLTAELPEVKEQILESLRKLDTGLETVADEIDLSDNPQPFADNGKINSFFKNEWKVFLEELGEVLPKRKVYRLLIRVGFLTALGGAASVALPFIGVVATKSVAFGLGASLGLYLTGEMTLKDLTKLVQKAEGDK